jgi:NADH:ubiquinone oxidoreductase subunit 6 (subunit J)
LLFAIFAILTIAGAAAAMSFRNVVRSVLALTLSFTGLAGVYLQLGAQFIGLAQILVYVGAVAILVVFAILLVRNRETPSQHIVLRSWKGSGTVALVVFGILVWSIHHSAASRDVVLSSPRVSMQQIGNALMQRFALPLEITGLLLTVALVGAVIIAMREKQEMR